MYITVIVIISVTISQPHAGEVVFLHDEVVSVIVIISVIIIVTISQPYAGEDHLDDYDRDEVHHHLYSYHCHNHHYACHILIITNIISAILLISFFGHY